MQKMVLMWSLFITVIPSLSAAEMQKGQQQRKKQRSENRFLPLLAVVTQHATNAKPSMKDLRILQESFNYFKETFKTPSQREQETQGKIQNQINSALKKLKPAITRRAPWALVKNPDSTDASPHTPVPSTTSPSTFTSHESSFTTSSIPSLPALPSTPELQDGDKGEETNIFDGDGETVMVTLEDVSSLNNTTRLKDRYWKIWKPFTKE